MVDKEYNLRAGVYKVQTFGTTHNQRLMNNLSFYYEMEHEFNEREDSEDPRRGSQCPSGSS